MANKRTEQRIKSMNESDKQFFSDWTFGNIKGKNSLTDKQTADALHYVINYYQQNGVIPDASTFQNYIGQLGTNEYEYIKAVFEQNKSKVDGLIHAQDDAENQYYRDVYGYDTAGTTGNKIYNQLAENNRAIAQSDYDVANTIASQAALQQAQVVKNIVDQVREERRAKLRAGYSEAQIANQDMTSLMSNINALNENAAAMNQAKIQAQYNYDTAQQNAYADYLNTANQMATAGSAYAAADAGDLVNVAKRMQQADQQRGVYKSLSYYYGQAQGSTNGS